jgi:hypothetical protein
MILFRQRGALSSLSTDLTASGLHVRIVDVHSGEASQCQSVDLGRWASLTFEIPQGNYPTELRINLSRLPCIVELAEISLNDAQSGSCLWVAREVADLRKLEFSQAVTLLPLPDRCWLLSRENDPSIHLPPLQTTSAVKVDISLRLERSFDRLFDALRVNIRELGQTMRPSGEQVDAAELRAELKNSQSERMLVAAQLSQIGADRQRLQIELDGVERALQTVRTELASARAEANSLRDSLVSEKALRSAMECSRSWRLLAPLRALMKKTKEQS